MNIKTGVKFHNRFDIEVRDKDTGKLKQKAVAENIVLNRMYTRICSFNSYFSCIHFGTGTGDLSPSRTTLFSSLGNKSAAIEEKIKAYPVSKVTRRIRLEPEEYIGSIITEVGVSETTSAINTHALIKDAEGNPLSLEKTELDVVIIYATVFIELQNPSEDFQFINLPNNSIVNYFLDGTTPSNTIACDRNKEMSNITAPVITQKTGTVTVSATNKTRNIKTRFGVSEANGNVRGIRVLNMLKVTLPHSNIYTGHDFEGVILGSGDGENKDFEIPNIYPEDIVIKKNGSITGDYQIKNNSLIEYKLQDLTGVGDDGNGVAISQDGSTIITASYREPFFTVQKLNENGTYGKLQDLTGAGMAGNGVAISPDGSTIITTSYNAPFFTVQKLNENGTYDKLQNLAGVGGGRYGSGVAISPDGSTIITASYSAPFFTVQKLNENGTYGKLQDLTGVGTEGKGATISPDGSTIITASNKAPFFTVQKLNENGTYDKLQDLTGVGNQGYGAAISQDGSTIITASNSAPYFTVQKLNENGTYDKLQDLTGAGGRGAALSQDGSTIITASGGEPSFTVQKLNENGTYDKLQDLTGVSGGNGAAISQDGSTIFTAGGAPYFTVQKLNEAKRIIKFNTPPAIDDVITADYSVDYIPKTEDYVLDVDFTLQFGEGV